MTSKHITRTSKHIADNDSNKHYASKGLIFKNQANPIKTISAKNTFDRINSSIANIQSLNVGTINANKNIYSPNAFLANINFNYDSLTNTTRLNTLSDRLDVCSVSFLENGDINIDTNLNIARNFKGLDGQFIGDIAANNANLLGDVISTNSHVTNNILVDGMTQMKHAIVTDSLDINGLLVADEITSNSMTVNTNANIRNILTNSVTSPNNLILTAGLGHTVDIPNIRHAIDFSREPIITPLAIKSAKIFMVNTNVILQADASCDGIEIIIVNNNPRNTIAIRDTTCIIDTICARTASKLIYLFALTSWIKI
jgi:hypothetical protein